MLCRAAGLSCRDKLINMQTAKGRRGSAMAFTRSSPPTINKRFVCNHSIPTQEREKGWGSEMLLEYFAFKLQYGNPHQTWERIFLPYPGFCLQSVHCELASNTQSCLEISVSGSATLAAFSPFSHIGWVPSFHHHSPTKELKAPAETGLHWMSQHPQWCHHGAKQLALLLSASFQGGRSAGIDRNMAL